MSILKEDPFDLLLQDGAFLSRESPGHGLLDLEATVFTARTAGLKKMLIGRMTTVRGNHMYTIGKRENANPDVLLAKGKTFQEKDDEKMAKYIQKTGELKFNEDDRFSDLEFNAIEHDIPSRSLILSVVYDPADSAKFVRMSNVYALNISKFGLQNVISHVEFFRGDGNIAKSFLKVAEADGFHMSRQELPEGGEFFVGIFVPANGAIIYIICDEVEKVSDSGVATYRI